MAKIIVIGANHAGTACINTLVGYKEHEVVVYDKNSNISFLGCGMALWIGEQISGSDGLFYSDKAKLEAAGAKVHMEADVYKIDFDNKKIFVRMADGSETQDNYDRLVLATGSLPITIPVPGADLENIQLVKLFQHAQTVIDKVKTGNHKKVAVLGGGYIGVELAEAFERLGLEVVLIDMLDTILGTYFDTEFNSVMKEHMEKNGVKMALGERVTEFIGENGKVKAVKTDKATHEVDMVVSCVGFRPNNALGKDRLDLFANGAYIVDRNQQTSEKDVYAVGDCATIYDNSIGDINYIALATNSVRSGIVGAHNVAGTDLKTQGVQGSSGICIYDLKMVNTGLTESKAKQRGIEVLTTSFTDTQKPAFMETENPKVDIKIVYRKDNRQVVGAQIMSTYDMSAAIHMFSLAIYKKVTIDEIALLDIFFMPHFNQPYNYITMAAITAK